MYDIMTCAYSSAESSQAWSNNILWLPPKLPDSQHSCMSGSNNTVLAPTMLTPTVLQAIRVMKDQPAGHIFNMDGAGADGSPTPRFAAYGATKRSLAQLGKSVSAELGQVSSVLNCCACS